jgi:hypothetical protein
MVGGLLVTPADQLAGGDGGGFGHPDHLQHEDAVKDAAGGNHSFFPSIFVAPRLGSGAAPVEVMGR